MYLLFPGRHQLLTNFQFEYLHSIIYKGLNQFKDIDGKKLEANEKVKAIIFAVTSANHSNTRRNPLPFYLRALALQEFSRELSIPAYIYGVDDVGNLPSFASYTLKRVRHESEGLFDLTPANCIVICSTPVLTMYEELGFRILPAELADRISWSYQCPLPWDLVENIASQDAWNSTPEILQNIHPSSRDLWEKYRLGEKVKLLFRDTMISEDGDITTTRDYNTYVRQMDEIAELKYSETASYVRPGRVGDIGCAVGSWIKLACHDDRFRESDFYGIEVARHLFDICHQRKHNGEFANPFVFFSQRNAVTGLVFDADSMNTIHTSSLTHEIESYGSRHELLQFIRNRYQELTNGGIWINRDVVGPYDKEKIVLMKLNKFDGRNDDFDKTFEQREELKEYLHGLSTYGRFLRFAQDFRKKEGYKLHYKKITIHDAEYIEIKLKDACEFMSRKDYIDNWQSEMHETFCFWDFNEWKQNLELAGFTIAPDSKAYTNEWIVTHRLKDKVELFENNGNGLTKLEYPVTNMILLGEKR
ncbi:MAG: transferase [Bacteroidota bacterium]